MSFSRANASGWSAGDKLTTTQANQIDIDHANAVDKTGDTLTATITLGAAGKLAVGNATASVDANVSGAKITASVSGAKISASAAGALIKTETGGRLQLGDNDWPTFSANRTKSRTVPGNAAKSCRGIASSVYYDPSLATQPKFTDQMLFTTGVNGSSGVPFLYLIDITAWMHNGATLSTVVLNYIAASGHSAVPAAGDMPGLDVYRRSAPSGSPGALAAATARIVESNVTLWNTTEHQVTYTCTQNNLIDTSAYTYSLVFQDECGANALPGGALRCVVLNFTAIADMQFP